MKERCSYCEGVFDEVKGNNPDWTTQQVLKETLMTLRDLRKNTPGCEDVICVPFQKAREKLNTLLDEVQLRNPPPLLLPLPKPEEEPEYLKQARQVVENFIIDQIKGRPDRFTAYSAAQKCACDNCVREYNSWIDLFAEDDPKFQQLKKPLRNKKHIDWNNI